MKRTNDGSKEAGYRRLYRLALSVMPRTLRERDGAELEQTFESVVGAARRRTGATGAARAALGEALDVAWTGMKLRLTWLDRRRAAKAIELTGRAAGHSAAVSAGTSPRTSGVFLSLFEDLVQDIRIGWRGLVRRPGHAVAAIGTLALGIGGTAAMYAAVRALLLRPLPYAAEDRIVSFWHTGDWTGPEFELVRDWRGPFEHVAATYAVDWTMRAGGGALGPGAVMVAGVRGTAQLFEVLGAQAARGRVFRLGDDLPGREPVVVISHGLWQGELGADPDIIGTTLLLDGTRHLVVGVMPADFFYPTPATRFWATVPFDPAQYDYGQFTIVGRLAPGVGAQVAHGRLSELTAVMSDRFQYSEGWDKTRAPSLTPIRVLLVGSADRAIALLFAAVSLILLIACANVGALVLGRSLDRAGEIAVRGALGAGRSRLARQVLTETMLLCGLGGAVGVGLAAWSFSAVRAFLPVDRAWRDTLVIDGGLAIAGLVLAVLAAALIGGLGLRAALGHGLRSRLHGGGSRALAAGGFGRVQSGLVIVQLALGIALVAGAASLVRSIAGLNAVDPGIDAAGVLAIDVVTGSGDFTSVERRAVLNRVVERAASLPAVQHAALTQRLPLRDEGWQGPTYAQDRPELEQAPTAYWRHVTPAYFTALGMPLRAGRSFVVADDERAPAVAIVSRSFARTMWPAAPDPIGKRLRLGSATSGAWTTVVGMVDDVPMSGLREEVRPVVYVPWAQAPAIMLVNTVIVRSTSSPAAISGALRDAVQSTDARLAVGRTVTMQTVMRQSIAEPQRLMLFLNIIAALALIIGGVGVHGQLANIVRSRRREFGVRLALGATPAGIVGFVLRRGAVLVAAGTAIGILASLLASRAYEAFLFDVARNDPVTLVASAIVLAGAGLIATWLPSRRAGRSDPVTVLRTD